MQGKVSNLFVFAKRIKNSFRKYLLKLTTKLLDTKNINNTAQLGIEVFNVITFLFVTLQFRKRKSTKPSLMSKYTARFYVIVVL